MALVSAAGGALIGMGSPPSPSRASGVAALLGYAPRQVSYAGAVAPFYARTGGLQREIAASLEAARRYPVNFGSYGEPRYGLIDDAIPVQYERLPPDTDAKYGGGLITVDQNLDPAYIHRAALPHEATHHIYLAGGGGERIPAGSLVRSLGSQLRKDSHRPFFDGELPFNSPYLNRPVELDAHLADVRRRYAALTGRVVRTPDDAADAWRWWVQSGRDASVDSGLPATVGRHTQYYDSLPQSAQDVMFRRMPGMAPAVLGPLLMQEE